MDKKRAGVIKLLILAVVLVAAIITGFLTGAIQPDALASSWAFSADVLLRLVIMMAGVLFVEYLVELILGYCKPEAHRARSVITIILKEKGLIERIGSDRKGYWKLLK